MYASCRPFWRQSDSLEAISQTSLTRPQQAEHTQIRPHRALKRRVQPILWDAGESGHVEAETCFNRSRDQCRPEADTLHT